MALQDALPVRAPVIVPPELADLGPVPLAAVLSRDTADSAAAEESLVAASDDNSIVDRRDTAANIGGKFAVVIGSGDFFRHPLDRDLYGHGGGMVAVDAVGNHAVVDIGDTAHRVMLCVLIRIFHVKHVDVVNKTVFTDRVEE